MENISMLASYNGIDDALLEMDLKWFSIETCRFNLIDSVKKIISAITTEERQTIASLWKIAHRQLDNHGKNELFNYYLSLFDKYLD